MYNTCSILLQLDRRSRWGGGRQNFTALALQPLNAQQTQHLIQKLSADLPENVRQQIVERSAGNPFFALELVRGLAEHGLTGDRVTLDKLPDTVHAAVLARMDLLTKTERTVLQVAAVISRTIGRSTLHAVLSEYSIREIDDALDGLQKRDMLLETEGNSFAFRHILIRDVAYGTLSRAERIRLHSKIAAQLETLAGEHLDEYAALLAYHYREAVLLARQSAVPKVLPHETERVVFFLRRAGELAGHTGAFEEARNYFQQALEIAPKVEHLALYEQFGDSLPWGETSVDAYRKALACWHEEGEKDPLIGARMIRKLFQVALAREDRPTIDAISSIITRAIAMNERTSGAVSWLQLFNMYHEDSVQVIGNLAEVNAGFAFPIIIFMNEHELIVPDDFLTNAVLRTDVENVVLYCSDIARALAANENTRLAQAIDRAEAKHLLVHAARMRIILARRIGDRTQLERARPILERLQDRRSLRKLEEVENFLPSV